MKIFYNIFEIYIHLELYELIGQVRFNLNLKQFETNICSRENYVKRFDHIRGKFILEIYGTLSAYDTK